MTQRASIDSKVFKIYMYSYANENLGQRLIHLKNSVVIHNGVDFPDSIQP